MKYTAVRCHNFTVKSLTIAELLKIAGKIQQYFKDSKNDVISEAMIRNRLPFLLNEFIVEGISEKAVMNLTSLQLDELWVAICDMNPQLKLLNIVGEFLIKILENNPELLLPNK